MARQSTKVRRGHGEGSIYQRASDKRWIGSIDLGIVAGKRRRKTVSAETRADVVRRLRELQRQLDAGVMSDQATVEDWLRYWLHDVAAQKVRESTLEGYQSRVNQWLIPNLGRVRLSGLTSKHVLELHKTMRAAGKSETTIRQAHAILQRALEIALRDGRVVRNAAKDAEAPKAAKNPHPHLWAEEAFRVLAGNPEPRDQARLACALLLGLRQGEALGLKWSRIELFERDGVLTGEMTIAETVQRRRGKGLRVTGVKSDHSERTLPLPPLAAAALRAWRDVNQSEWVFPGYVTTNPESPRRDYQAWLDCLNRAGVRRVPLHGARGSAASALMALNVPVPVIADILGQGTITVTERHYLHSSPEQIRAALMQLSDRYALPA